MIAWKFDTANLSVRLLIEPEDMDPADSFEFQEDIDAVRNGAVEWFSAHVQVVTHDGHELARDVLGGCAYHTIDEFYTSHRDADPLNRNCSIMRAARGANTVMCHYFPSMVKEACREARQALRDIRAIPVRD